ncbi:MAG TPA: FHA domain-containing protein, partial [Thermoanaerobaculia bacterium]
MSDGRWRYVLTVGGRDIEFGEGEVTLGRSRTATVRVEHESVSRSHALLTFERGNAVLKDLNSSNGTFAGGKRILNETRLVDKETIQLGAAVIGYQVIPPDQSSERTTLLDTGVGTIPAPAFPPEPPDEVSGD